MSARMGRPAAPMAVMPVVGETRKAGGLTTSDAVRDWVPWPVSVLAKVTVALYVPAARVFATLALTVNVTGAGVPEVTVPVAAEGMSQLEAPDIDIE